MEPTQASKSGQPWSPVELISYVVSRWKMVIAVTVVCATASAIVAFILPKKYESSSALMLMPAPVKEAKGKDAQLIGLFVKNLSVKDYCLILKSDGILTKVGDRITQGGALGEKDLKKATNIGWLSRATSIETTVLEKTAYTSSYSPVITLIVDAPDPALAREVAQAWADVAVEEASDIGLKGRGGQAEFLDLKLKTVQESFDKTLAEQESLDGSYDPDSAAKRLADMTTLETSLESTRYNTQADLEMARKSLEELKAQLALLPQKITLLQAPPETALYLEKVTGAKTGAATPPANPGGKEFRGYEQEELNPAYTDTADLMVAAAKDAKGLEEKEKTLTASIAQLKEQIESERKSFARFKKEHKLLDKMFTIESATYQDLADGLAKAQIAESHGTLGDLKIAAKAVAPTDPIAPNRRLILATALIVGFVLSCAFLGLKYTITLE